MPSRKASLLFTVVVVLLAWARTSPGDSPLTSTKFHDLYADHAIVAKAAERETLDVEMAEYVSDSRNSIDVKIALANALSWNFEGKSNAERLHQFLRIRYEWDPSTQLLFTDLTWHEATVLGYLAALDDYFDPVRALNILAHARRLNRRSFAVALVESLVKAQVAFDSDWCEVWRTYERVLLDESLVRDFRENAIAPITEYLILYKPECK